MLLVTVWAGLGNPRPAHADRVKDLVNVLGVRSNQLIGYGLVVGLEGSGDSFFRSNFTQQSLANFLKKLGILLDERTVRNLRLRNSAAVMAVAGLPAFVRQGSRVDVIVSSLGDARSLQGGTLLMTPLKGADGKVYAVAQGPISVGGFEPGKASARAERNHMTTGRISGGALVEHEVVIDLQKKESLTLLLINPDFTTSSRIAQAINAGLGGDFASPVDASAVQLRIPEDFRGNVVDLVSAIEALDVEESSRARVVMDERTGTVVMGENLQLKPVAVAHGELHITIAEEGQEPLPLSPQETIILPSNMEGESSRKERVLMLPQGPTLGEIVKALNTIGVEPRDLIAILQALRAAGALNAQIDFM
ncbi:MAG: flagellar basal body P-ring protein FlgI [Nitrospirae bacterium]|nr:flagellar basal body P-ring protein FlgI [Nitrospirota bacterium]